MVEILSSNSNPKIKNVLALQEKSKIRREQGVFVVEGLRELKACLSSSYELDSIYYNSQLISEKEIENLVQKESNLDIRLLRLYSLNAELYSKIAYRGSTEGLVAVVKIKKTRLEDIKLKSKYNPLILVLESVEKPGNLGALLRTADASGVDAVLVCDPLTDLYNPNLIRASIGSVFTVQVVSCTSRDAHIWLEKNGIKIFTAQLQDADWYYKSDMVQPTAIVMGSEAEGLSDFWRTVSHAKIKIPMLGKMDSLNVSVSAAILCYEAVRQRNTK